MAKGKKSSKEDVTVVSADSNADSNDSDDAEPEYTVERVVDMKSVKGKVSKILNSN